jgi:hypothetical protein
MTGFAGLGQARTPTLRPHLLRTLGALLLAGAAHGQEPGPVTVPADPKPSLAQTRQWKEGSEIRLRVPVATESLEVMCGVSFPETGIRAAVTGWGESTLTSVQQGSYLFLRLSKRAEGQLNVIGESGTHYLLYIEAVDAKGPGGYDSFVKIVRPLPQGEGEVVRKLAKGERPKPKGALDLIRSMRLGERREGTRVLRAKGEVVYSSPDVELRLLFVYQSSSYIGRIYEVRNLSGRKLALDASRFRAAGDDLVLSGLRENVIPPGGVSRIYTVFWRP